MGLAFPLQAQGAVNQVWQVAFHFQNASLQSMAATQAHALGYGVNTTATRVLFRTPYNTQQTEVTKVEESYWPLAKVPLRGVGGGGEEDTTGGEGKKREGAALFLGHSPRMPKHFSASPTAVVRIQHVPTGSDFLSCS